MNDDTDRVGDIRTDTGPFVQIPVWVIQSGVSPRAIQLYAILAHRADYRTGKTWPTKRKTLAADLGGVSLPTVDKALRELVSVEALTITPRFDEHGDRAPSDFLLHRAFPGHKENLVTGGKENLAARSSDPKASDEERPDGLSSLPKVVKIDGRNLGFDALAQACLVHDNSPRRKSIGPALASIREQAWAEIEFGKEHGPEAFERWLAKRIHDRADLYRRKMPTVHLTPTALAKWWTDLPSMPDPRDGRSGSAADALDIAEAAVREARGQRGDP